MVRDLVAYRVLPPGGRTCGAYTGAAQDAAGVTSEARTAEEAEVFVHQDVCVLECSEGDQLDGWLAEVIGASCRELRTRGDGACAMHATFGRVDPTAHELRCQHPRVLLRELLAKPLDIIRRSVRPAHVQLVDAVVSSLWTDFVVPSCGR